MKRINLVIVSVILLVLVGGAAFTAARLWTAAQAETGLPQGGGRMLQLARGGEGPQFFSLEIEPAPELPARPVDIQGIFVRREDDNIFVGTGEIEMMVELDPVTGKKSVHTGHKGPMVEVVVNRETLLYEDRTDFELQSGENLSGNLKIQQQVQLIDTLDGVGENSEIQVWGERRGDRVVAELFVFRNPALVAAK